MEIFRAVLARYAERPKPPRYELANVPVAFWLIPYDGEECVPLVQVRRALATFVGRRPWMNERIAGMVRASIAFPMSASVDSKLRQPLRERVESRIEQDLATRPEQADSAWLAKLLTKRTGIHPANAERIREVSEAALRGLGSFRELDDNAYHVVRMRYREDYLRSLPPDVLAENACTDLLTVLGRIASERGLA
jgi:hypothetical protein